MNVPSQETKQDTMTQRHAFLLPWPWPWPNDLHIQTWSKIFRNYVDAFKALQTDRQIDRKCHHATNVNNK